MKLVLFLLKLLELVANSPINNTLALVQIIMYWRMHAPIRLDEYRITQNHPMFVKIPTIVPVNDIVQRS